MTIPSLVRYPLRTDGILRVVYVGTRALSGMGCVSATISRKLKVLVIGKQFSGACEQTERPGVSKTKWPIGTEEKSFKYLGVTIGKRLEWKAHVADIVSLSKPKHRQVQPLAANPHVDPAVVEQRRFACGKV